MTPEKIDQVETSFASTLTDSSKTVFTAGDRIDLGGGYSILQIRPKYSSYYYSDTTAKSKVVLHFTVGSLKGDIATLTKQDSKVSVSYVVDRQGNIYNLFDDTKWSYHLGKTCIGGNSVMSKSSIGIEVSNYGPLTKDGSKYLDAYKNTYTTLDDMVDQIDYRGYKYYAKMTERQIDAICYLLHYLCNKHSIPDTFKGDIGTVFSTATEAVAFQGICCHTDVRSDKFDFPTEQAGQISLRYAELFHPVEMAPEPEEPAPAAEPVADVAPTVQAEPTIETMADSEPTTTEKSTSSGKVENSSILDVIIKLIMALIGKL